MAKAPARPALLGPPIIQALSRIDPTLSPVAAPQLPVVLSQWVDWNRAVTLASALDGRLPEAPETVPGATALADEVATAQARLADAVDTALEGLASGAKDLAAVQKAYAGIQRAAQAASGRLRGQLRDALAAGGAETARLAQLDAVMEQTLSPRETRLLERLPARLQALAPAVSGQAPDDSPEASPGWPDGLPEALQHELRALLQAELTLRFHPIEGLLAALGPH